MPKITAATVNKALKAAGHPERIVQGKGYAFFIEGDAPLWPESGIYGTNRITDVQDLQFWLDNYNRLKAKYESNRIPADPDDYSTGKFVFKLRGKNTPC